MKEILTQSVFFGVVLSLLCFQLSLWIKQKTKLAVANPVLLSVLMIIAVLLLFDIDYEVYEKGAGCINFFLTPATVSLAIPLYRQLALLKNIPRRFLAVSEQASSPPW